MVEHGKGSLCRVMRGEGLKAECEKVNSPSYGWGADLVFGLLCLAISIPVLCWMFTPGFRRFTNGIPPPFDVIMVGAFFGGFAAIGVMCLCTGVFRFSRPRNAPARKGSLSGKFFFMIIGATFAAIGVGFAGASISVLRTDLERDVPAFLRFFMVALHGLVVVFSVAFALAGLAAFSIGVYELLRPKRRKARSVVNRRLRRQPAFERKSSGSHYHVKITSQSLSPGSSVAVSYSLVGDARPNSLKVSVCQSDCAIREEGGQLPDMVEVVHETDSPAIANSGSFEFSIPAAMESEHIGWALHFSADLIEDTFTLPL